MTDITVRPLGEDDWEDYRSVRLAALRESPEAFVATVEQEEAYDEDFWRQRMQRSARLVAEREGRAIGVVSVGTATGNEETAGELFGLWVRPEARGSGVATRLVKDGASPEIPTALAADGFTPVASDPASRLTEWRLAA